MKIQIKSRWDASLLFEFEAAENSLKITLQAAVKARANLGGANLGGAYLGGAYLGGANLRGVNLRGANLGRAYLGGADLGGADLRGANLREANLGGANLREAKISDTATAVGKRPYFAIGPIGRREDMLIAWLTDKGIFVQAGCFYGPLAEFREKVIATHGANEHGKEYSAAISLIETHATLWMPPADAKDSA
jgi:hypothetical protein